VPPRSTRPQATAAPGRTAARTPPPRIVLQFPQPAVDGGRFPAKRCAGDRVTVSVDAFRDGHERIRVIARARRSGTRRWEETELAPIDAHLDGVRWAGEIEVDRIGRWELDFIAWTDRFGTWREELRRKLEAGQHELGGELSEGAALLREAAVAAAARGARQLELIERALAALENAELAPAAREQAGLGEDLYTAVESCQPRHDAVSLPEPLALEVDRERARFGAWYELFPRSWGGLAGVQAQLPVLAELGFDVVYLAPIHPIGHTNRKGRDNALSAGPDDPGSPWAIGDETGGHEAVHPDLGTIEDVRNLAAAAREHGLELALDFAIQCSADHPWLREHPEWFHRRPDGTLKYAENPPKRYQDIYNVNWESSDWRGLWNALLEIVLGWVDCGIKVFRVDNPHTKPFRFWSWLIERVHNHDREVVFLAEAFTRRAVMRHLAKVGFSQSYTYFTWKNARWELTEYLSQLAHTEEREYFRPNFFANTPDILHAYLQHGGRPAFEARLILAATLSPSYGIYSGFENLENVAVREGSEEYLHSEKYEIKERRLDGELLGLIGRVNHIRRAHPALQRFENVTFLETENDALLAYAKQWGADTVICIVNLDPSATQEGLAVLGAGLGLPPAFSAHDLLTDERYAWRIGRNYVRLDPGYRQAHLLAVEP
jgi:starch synthase (maltosyl-transferring)